MAEQKVSGSISTAEGIESAFIALGIGQEVIDAVKALPASPKAVDYARAFGASEDGIQMRTAKLIDKVREDLRS